MAPRAKLVDKWIYKYTGIEGLSTDATDPVEGDEGDEGDAPAQPGKVGERIVEVELRLIKETKETEAAPYPLSAVKFEVWCADPAIRMVGTDVEALRKAAWGELDARFKVKWEQYFLVTVERSRIYGGGEGNGLEFVFKSVDKGTAHDGTLLLREWRAYRSSGEPWDVRPWPGEFKDSKGNVMACIPATDENRAALEQFSKGIDALRGRIADHLRPHNILQTLANLSGVALSLAPPSEED